MGLPMAISMHLHQEASRGLREGKVIIDRTNIEHYPIWIIFFG
jgi:hypothetical protein